MSAVYRILKKSSRPEPESVLSLQSGKQRKKVVEPIFVSLDGFDRSMIIKECGKLKKTLKVLSNEASECGWMLKSLKDSQWAKYLDECFAPVKVPTIQPEELDSES